MTVTRTKSALCYYIFFLLSRESVYRFILDKQDVKLAMHAGNYIVLNMALNHQDLFQQIMQPNLVIPAAHFSPRWKVVGKSQEQSLLILNPVS